MSLAIGNEKADKIRPHGTGRAAWRSGSCKEAFGIVNNTRFERGDSGANADDASLERVWQHEHDFYANPEMAQVETASAAKLSDSAVPSPASVEPRSSVNPPSTILPAPRGNAGVNHPGLTIGFT